MDKDVKDVNGLKDKPLVDDDSPKDEDHYDEVEEFNESQSLLPPRTGGMSKNPDKTRRKVQWNDTNGNKLAEVLVYEPSDASDSDEEDSDSCICTIM